MVLYPPKPIIDRLKSEGKDIPKASFRALIDTGAESTSISQNEIESIGLVSRDFRELIGTSGQKELRPVYDVTLNNDFSNKVEPVQINFEVSTINLDKIGVYALLGRDVLRHCELKYNGIEGEFELNFISGE